LVFKLSSLEAPLKWLLNYRLAQSRFLER